jgi:predicted nucleic acid-binding protein
MNILLDTNILTRMAQPGHAHQPAALGATSALRTRGDVLCLVPQVIYEFWVVATRPPAVNGLGLAVPVAAAEVTRLKSLFPLLPDTPALFPVWERLVTTHLVAGKNAHDARLVAAMAVHGLTHLLTFNTADFARFPGVTTLDPLAVAP